MPLCSLSLCCVSKLIVIMLNVIMLSVIPPSLQLLIYLLKGSFGFLHILMCVFTLRFRMRFQVRFECVFSLQFCVSLAHKCFIMQTRVAGAGYKLAHSLTWKKKFKTRQLIHVQHLAGLINHLSVVELKLSNKSRKTSRWILIAFFWLKQVPDRGPEQRESQMNVLSPLIIIILISYIITYFIIIKLSIMENHPSWNGKWNSFNSCCGCSF